jgi:hypothetical protein
MLTPNLTWTGASQTWATLLGDDTWGKAGLGASDTPTLTLSEARLVLLVMQPSVDTLTLTAVDTSFTPFVLLNRPDTLTLTLAEAAAVAVVVGAVDLLTLTLAEARALLVGTQAADLLTLTANDVVNVVFVRTAVDDPLTITLSETHPPVLVMLVRADSTTLTLSELAFMAVVKEAVDDLILRLEEDSIHCIENWPDQKPLTGVWTEHPATPLLPEGCNP